MFHCVDVMVVCVCVATLEIEVRGPEVEGLGSFLVRVERINPAIPGAVTGTQTYDSFLSSLLRAKDRGPGLHFC
jgi:hypothetical protein